MHLVVALVCILLLLLLRRTQLFSICFFVFTLAGSAEPVPPVHVYFDAVVDIRYAVRLIYSRDIAPWTRFARVIPYSGGQTLPSPLVPNATLKTTKFT